MTSISFALAHPHDHLVRNFLDEAWLVSNMLEEYGGGGVARYIDLTSIRLETPVNIDGKLKETIGDLRFSATLRNSRKNNGRRALIFFEHQSTIDDKMAFRGLKSIIGFYERTDKKHKNTDNKENSDNTKGQIGFDTTSDSNANELSNSTNTVSQFPKDENDGICDDGKVGAVRACRSKKRGLRTKRKYPLPVLLVLYHGKRAWHKFRSMKDLIYVPRGFRRRLLDYPVVVIDLAKIPRDQLRGHPALQVLFDTLQSSSANDLAESLERIAGRFTTIRSDPRVKTWFDTIVTYALAVDGNIDEQILSKAYAKILTEQEANRMATSTMQRLLNEGEARGRVLGEARGRVLGEALGEARGEARGRELGAIEGKIASVKSILLKRFNQVDSSIFKSLEQYNDPVALESLVVQAALCDSLNEFEQMLAHRD